MFMSKKGKYQALIFGLDVIGFVLILLGAAMLRFAKNEVLSILSSLIVAIGLAILGLTRIIPK